MQPEAKNITIQWDSDAERERFLAIYPDTPESVAYLNMGIANAEKSCVPTITAGGYGDTADAIEKGIEGYFSSARLKRVFRQNSVGADLQFVYRIGYRSRARMAKDAFLSSLAEIPRQHGESAGRQAALQPIGATAVRPETGPHVGAILAAALSQSAKAGIASGLPEAGVEKFAAGYADGVSSVLDELNARHRMPGAQKPSARPLRPEDFGAMPGGHLSDYC